LVSSYGSAGEDAGLSLAINQAGSALYLAGYASGAVRMNDNSIVSVAHDQMIASLDPITLNMTWSRFIGGLGFSDRAVGIAIHPQTDLIYSSGFISSSIVNSGSNFQKTSYGNYDLTLTALHPNGTILWTRVAGSNLDDQGGGLAFNSNGVLFVAARINNSDGYLVHTLDSSGNNSFQKPNLTVNLPSFSSCYSNPWISTSTRTLFSIFTSYSFFTLACTPTTNVLTQINSLGYLTITETVYQSLIVTAGGSNEGSAGANSIDLTSNSTFVIMIALISLCLLMSAIIITLMWRKNSSSHDKNSDIRLLSPSGGVLPQSIFGEPVRRDSSFSPPTQIAANNLTATAYSSVNYQSYTDGTTRTE
jgi:hypothetical protein